MFLILHPSPAGTFARETPRPLPLPSCCHAPPASSGAREHLLLDAALEGVEDGEAMLRLAQEPSGLGQRPHVGFLLRSGRDRLSPEPSQSRGRSLSRPIAFAIVLSETPRRLATTRSLGPSSRSLRAFAVSWQTGRPAVSPRASWKGWAVRRRRHHLRRAVAARAARIRTVVDVRPHTGAGR